MTKNRHYFWGEARPGHCDLNYEQTASRMYLEENRIVVEAEMYDHEDNRLYESSGSFDVSDYQRALKELDDKNEACVVNPKNGSTLSLKGKDTIVQIRMSGATYLSNTPGGAACGSTTVFHIKRDRLQLPNL